MDLLRRLFAWLRGDNTIVDFERAITNEVVEPTNLDLRIFNHHDFISHAIPPERTCDCQVRVTALEEAIDRLTSRVSSLCERMTRNDADIDGMRNFIRLWCAVEYSPNYSTEEQERIPEQFVEAAGIQQDRIQSPVVSDEEVRTQQNQNQALNRLHEESTSQSVQPSPQEVLRSSSPRSPNRTNRNITVAQCYKMDHQNRGLCMVFIHKHFTNPDFSTRESALEEAIKIKDTFEKLGYRVKICLDYTYSEIEKQLRELESLVYPDDDSVCICISTHGREDTFCALDCTYPMDIFENTLIKIKKLAEKPKLIFIQACRGNKVDRGISLSQPDHQSEDYTDGLVDSRKHPSRADFLIIHSTPYGYVSWRDWFFENFCDMLDRFSEIDDIDEIYRKTARKICELESQRDDDMAHAKQVPTFYSTLTKRLFLKRM